MPTLKEAVKTPLKYARGPKAYSEKNVVVEREGGEYGAGVIRRVSVLQRGEALGHEMWVDETMLTQVADAINGAKAGVKARHTHPSMSADGTGKALGKYIGPAEVVGDKVVADLHFVESAHKTPYGNLADYYMTNAESSPDLLGVSIVFDRDPDAMGQFMEDNTDEELGFVSPDMDNENNYEHARVAHLRAADFVDSPAANRDGMFAEGNIPEAADRFAEFVLGLSEELPGDDFELDPGRAKAYLARLLDRHDLEIVPKKGDQQMSDTNTPPAKSETELRAEIRAEQKRFSDYFGADRGVEYFNSDLTWQAALEKDREHLLGEIKTRDEKIAELEGKLDSLNLGEEEGAGFNSGDDRNEPGGRKTLLDAVYKSSKN